MRRLIGRSGLCLAGSALLAEACIEKWAGRESSTVRFASDATYLKGYLARRSCGGCSTSEVEFSKGYRQFASVITLAERGIAVKAEASL